MSDTEHIAAMGSDKNSMDFWYSNLLKDPDIRELVPGTIRVSLDLKAIYADADASGINPNALLAAATAVWEKRNVISGDGERPVFMRTDQYSNKHHWEDSCYLPAGELTPITIAERMYAWLEECDGMFGPPPPKSVFVRHFLSLKTAFLAFDNMPVAREFRFFATAEGVSHWQPYWPYGAISTGWAKTPLPDDWRDQLAKLNELRPDEFKMLSEVAMRAAALQGGDEWSVDLCQDTDGRWWLTDMALGACSYRYTPGQEDFDEEPAVDMSEYLKQGDDDV